MFRFQMLARLIVIILFANAFPVDVALAQEPHASFELAGTWEIIVAREHGKDRTELKGEQLLFGKKGVLTIIDPVSDIQDVQIGFRVSGGSSASIDIIKLDSDKQIISRGIFKKEKGYLIICWATPGGKRPVNFSAEPADEQIRLTLKPFEEKKEEPAKQ